MVGMIRKIFMRSERASSILPRKYPALIPIRQPTIVVAIPTRNPICSVNRAPQIVCAQTSRPRPVVPNQFSLEGGRCGRFTNSLGSPGEITGARSASAT
jgi:hypothetical protein